MREGVSQAEGQATTGLPPPGPGNGSHEGAAGGEREVAAEPVLMERPREAPEPPPAREFHSEPRETSGTHETAPVAHFEPTPKPEAGSAKQPYVVWSSAPVKDAGPRGSEE
jgi:hypothetical protein